MVPYAPISSHHLQLAGATAGVSERATDKLGGGRGGRRGTIAINAEFERGEDPDGDGPAIIGSLHCTIVFEPEAEGDTVVCSFSLLFVFAFFAWMLLEYAL